jgi:hypothetical protein
MELPHKHRHHPVLHHADAHFPVTASSYANAAGDDVCCIHERSELTPAS